MALRQKASLMDVPAWHPANQDADLQRALLAPRPARTEFKVMHGSTADTSTDAGRALMDDLTRGGTGGSGAVEGRGFFDASDRLFLQEQKRMEAAQLAEKNSQQEAALHEFRSSALKAQTRKVEVPIVSAAPPAPVPPKRASITTAVVKVKPRKREAASTRKAKRQRKESNAEEGETRATQPKDSQADTKATTAACGSAAGAGAALLLVGYSSSDSDSDSAPSKPND